ncbi:hypothetical protein Patl1_17478 [Pistacia atlantica]|uniref:Uncharacterized protein n=1 Tax=Pistacia atlantica TaxID=434234 RepID=A0ACC1BYH7_9ROSI|nr:hypothetical protein Patl1_17478 [Pistacia atlantica]
MYMQGSDNNLRKNDRNTVKFCSEFSTLSTRQPVAVRLMIAQVSWTGFIREVSYTFGIINHPW